MTKNYYLTYAIGATDLLIKNVKGKGKTQIEEIFTATKHHLSQFFQAQPMVGQNYFLILVREMARSID